MGAVARLLAAVVAVPRRRKGGGAWPHVVLLEPFNAGLAVARSMRRLGARVTVVNEPGHELVARSRGVEGLVASTDDDCEEWVQAIESIARDSEEVAVIPASDAGSELLVRVAERMPGNVRSFEHGASAHTSLMDKQRATDIALRAGVSVPWTMHVGDEQQLRAALAQAPWPCVVKPVMSHRWRALYGGERVFLAGDAQQAESLLVGPMRDGLPMLLSQYVPGGEDHLEEATLVRLADGSYPVGWGCRKLRQFPVGFGTTTVAESADVPEAMALAMRVLEEADFVGVANVETKRHRETGESWFLEVNVRLPVNWGLGDACGAQASRRLVAAMTGRAMGPAPAPRPGVRLAFPELDRRVVLPALAAAPMWQRPALALRMAGAYRGVRDLGLFDPRDPGPALALAGNALKRRVRPDRDGFEAAQARGKTLDR
jgi:predicted ATP-grasp superfamily ATP-dependent carboligase